MHNFVQNNPILFNDVKGGIIFVLPAISIITKAIIATTAVVTITVVITAPAVKKATDSLLNSTEQIVKSISDKVAITKATPPGDCEQRTYYRLRGDVENSKHAPKCEITDDCIILKGKRLGHILHAAARITIMTVCFKGGDLNHKKAYEDTLKVIEKCDKYIQKKCCN